jgi:hypothetical protein
LTDEGLTTAAMAGVTASRAIPTVAVRLMSAYVVPRLRGYRDFSGMEKPPGAQRLIW